MTKMQRILWVAVCVCMMLSACGQHSAHSEQTMAGGGETAVPETVQTIPKETESLETKPHETEPAAPEREPEDPVFVDVKKYIPDIAVELKYSTEDNFTGQCIYDFNSCYLRYGTVKKLIKVQDALVQQGLGLKIWDGFRPVSAQFTLWEVCPDPTYVANPETGFSSHSRGNTVDVTMIDASGREVVMPTGFDDFSALADRDYSDCDAVAAKNARRLQSLMEENGFTGYFGEWWHFSDTEKYDVETVFDPAVISVWYADCEAFISLRTAPDTSAEVITRIPVGEEFTLLGYAGDFSQVNYQGKMGYVLTNYTDPVSQRDTLAVPDVWTPNCEEFITLRKNTEGEFLDRIPLGETFRLLNWEGEYAEVEYSGQRGYVLSSYIRPEKVGYFGDCLDIVLPTAVYSYEQMREDLIRLTEAYPNAAELDSVGTSEFGKEIPVLRIGMEDAPNHVLIHGAIHGREHMTAWLLAAMADYWMEHGCENYPDVCIHMIPMVNPDGVAISQTGQLNDVQLSIYGEDVHFGYTEAGKEQYAALWKANGMGVDLNRNFPAGWQLVEDRTSPSSMLYRGDAPFCAAETAALRDYTLSWDFDATVSYHASGCVIYWEYGDTEPVNERSLDLAMHLQAVTGYIPRAAMMWTEQAIRIGSWKNWGFHLLLWRLEHPWHLWQIGSCMPPLQEMRAFWNQLPNGHQKKAADVCQLLF